MKKGAIIALATSLSMALIASGNSGVSFDAEKHTVSFTAASTDCGLDMQIEFLFVGPDSDHDYEAMFVTDAPIAEIAAAFRKAGIPSGRDFNGAGGCRFWPVGQFLSMEPAITNFLRETRGETTPVPVFTGGTRDASGIPEANTNSPGAVFALYNCAQSLIQFDDTLDQSETYGRFTPAVKIPKGEKRRFTFKWNGEQAYESIVLPLMPGKLADAITTLKSKSADKELDVLCDFSTELTIKEASEISQALSIIDSRKIKINGYKDGQFFYRAFQPLEKWRDRTERLAQPPEVHFRADGTFVVTETFEDWSDDESLDPKLTSKDIPCADIGDAAKEASRIAAKTFTVLIFAPSDTKLGKLFDFRKACTGPIINWYIFTE